MPCKTRQGARYIGTGAVAHWHILGHWLTWSNPAHLPAGRPHLSYSAWVGLGLGLGLGLGEGGGDNFDEGGGVAREAAVMAPEAMAREVGEVGVAKAREVVGGCDRHAWVQVGITASVGVSLDRIGQQPVHRLSAQRPHLKIRTAAAGIVPDLLDVRYGALSLHDAALG